MNTMTVTSSKSKEVLDITDMVNSVIENGAGVIHLLALHTTVALTTSDLDAGTDHDLLESYTHIVPKLAYRHPHDPSHVPDHILSAMIGTSLTVPFQDGACVLGTWQRIILIDFNGPKNRSIAYTIIKE